MCLPVATVSPSPFRLTRHSIHANVFPIFTTSHVTVTRSPNLAGAQYEQLRSVLTPPRVVIVNSATVVSTSTSVATHPPCNVPKRLVSSDVTSSSHSNAPRLGNLGREHRRRGAASYVPAATASCLGVSHDDSLCLELGRPAAEPTQSLRGSRPDAR